MSERRSYWLDILLPAGLTILHLYGAWPVIFSTAPLLHLSVVAIRLAVLWKCNLRRNTAFLILWVCLDVGFFGYLVALDDELLNLFKVREENLAFTCGLGGMVLASVGITLYLSNFMRNRGRDVEKSRRESISWQYAPHWVTGRGLFWLFAIAMVLSLVSLFTGVGALGQQEVRLPFKMSGLLNLTRLYAVGLFFIVILDIAYERGQRNRMVQMICIYVLWLVLEVVVRLSRGVLIEGVLPMGFWLVYRNVLKRNHVLLFCGCLALVLATAQFVTYYRQSLGEGTTARGELLRQVSAEQDAFGSLTGGLSFTLLRVFQNGMHVSKYQDALGDRVWGNQFFEVVEIGGSALYHTRIIDNVPDSVVHSSGTSLIADAYIMGGVPFALATAVLFACIAIGIDVNGLGFLTSNAAMKANVTYLYMDFCIGGFWVWIFKPALVQGFLLGIFIFIYSLKWHSISRRTLAS